MNSVLVLGTDEFFGLTLCEKLLDEGFDVHAVLLQTQIKEKRILIEERLLWLVRNEHFHVKKSAENLAYKHVYIIYSDSLDERIWKERKDAAFLLAYHDEPRFAELNEQKPERIITIHLPKMYGPWDSSCMSERTSDCFFVTDVADKLIDETIKSKPKTYLQNIERKTSIEEAEKLIEEWQRQFPTKIDKI